MPKIANPRIIINNMTDNISIKSLYLFLGSTIKPDIIILIDMTNIYTPILVSFIINNQDAVIKKMTKDENMYNVFELNFIYCVPSHIFICRPN